MNKITQKINKRIRKDGKSRYGMVSNSLYMVKYAWNVEKSVIVICLISVFLAIALNLLQLFILPTILKNVEEEVSLNKLVSTILIFTIALLVVGSARMYFNANTIFGRLEIRTNLTFKIHEKLSVTSYPNIGEQKFLKMLDRAGSAVSGNEGAIASIWDTFTELMQCIIGLIIYLFLFSTMNSFVVFITVATTIIGYFVNNYINGWGYRHREEEAEYSHKLQYISNKIQDHLLAKDLLLFGMKQWLEDVYTSSLNLYKDFVKRGEKIYIWANILDVVLAFLRNGFVYVYLIYLSFENVLTASEFLLYFSAVGGFTTWINKLFDQFSRLHLQSLDISNMREYLDVQEPFKFDAGEPLEPDLSKNYEIELRNVSFRYPETEKYTLRNISLTISSGEKVAVVGLNGAGKTTLIKLICGFLDPTEGEICLNDKDIRIYNRQDYYRLFSAVFQQFSILATTIAGNVAQSIEHVNMEKVRLCIRQAGLTKKIESLKDTYGTHLCKEVFDDALEFSGGEIQRLMLARALYKNAPIIVLDEPTAAMDPIAEKDIYEKYNELMAGRMAIYISHRLASTRFCNRILLIEDGAIIEEGNHNDLLNKKGKYAELFQTQSKYYQEGGKSHEEKEI